MPRSARAIRRSALQPAGGKVKALAELPERLRPLTWAIATFLGGVFLHVDRIPIWITGFACALSAWRIFAALRGRRLPGVIVRAVIALSLAGAVLVTYRTLNGLAAGTALLVTMGAVKLLETRARRDDYIMVGAGLFLVLAACLDRQGLTRAPLYLAEVWLACSALAIIASPASFNSARQAIRLAGRTLLLAIPLALILFLFFPRVAGSFWTLPEGQSARTGLSDEMSPGEIDALTEWDDPAFRVTFEDGAPPPTERYWRGPVLHDFDGTTWRRARNTFQLKPAIEYEGRAYRYRVQLEPNGRPWWFALDTPVGSPEPRVFFTYDLQLISPDPVSQPVAYSLTSHTRIRMPEPLSLVARKQDTALPAGRNPKTRDLARRMRQSVSTDFAYIEAVLDLFRKGGFTYTLTPPRLDRDSVDEFIFETRQGFCGHYASAFTSMMRAGGVPARVVTGYLGGEWNPVGQYWLIKQSDAHAWSEVWLEGRGWTRVDPTGVVAPERLQRGLYDFLPDAASLAHRFSRDVSWIRQSLLTWDAVNAWWRTRVIEYDLRSQLRLLDKLGFDAPDWTYLGVILAFASALWLGWIAWVSRGSVLLRRGDALAQAYATLSERLGRVGLPRLPAEAPLTYANRVSEERPDLARTTRELIDRYTALRYGPTVEDDTERTRLAKALRRDVRALRPSMEVFPRAWRDLLDALVPLRSRWPRELGAEVDLLTQQLMTRWTFVGCGGLRVTDEMRLVIAMHAALLVVRRTSRYEALYSVLIYPDEFVVEESEEDETGVVTTGERALSGQTIDTSRIVLSWQDICDGLQRDDGYNVVLHEFAHFLDHELDGLVASAPIGDGDWHVTLQAEYDALCAAVDRGEETLIDPYGSEHLAEFFAVATEAFFGLAPELRERHPALYAQLREFYGVDPATWG